MGRRLPSRRLHPMHTRHTTSMPGRRDDKVLAAWRRFSGATPADVPAPLRRMVELAVATAASAGG
jgi:hypothetical protein